MSWIYLVNKGIKHSVTGLSIEFEADREFLRKVLSFDPQKNIGRFDREDSYETIGDSSDWIRLTFDDEHKLREIEVILGTVSLGDLEIFIEGDLRATIAKLETLGIRLIRNDYGYVSNEFKFDLGDGELTEGEENKISWFYASTDVSHLIPTLPD